MRLATLAVIPGPETTQIGPIWFLPTERFVENLLNPHEIYGASVFYRGTDTVCTAVYKDNLLFLTCAYVHDNKLSVQSYVEEVSDFMLQNLIEVCVFALPNTNKVRQQYLDRRITELNRQLKILESKR